MFGSAKKVPTTCPHCGSVQLEPRELISTYCRSCGDHFTVTPAPAPITRALPTPSPLARRLREKLAIHRRRHVACIQCGHAQHVPAHTQDTQCPACGATIDLHDIQIPGHSTRIVETRGTVHVGRDGFLNSTRVTCGNAFVEGRIAGKVTCEGTLRLRGEGICRAQIRTRRFLIDRGTNLRFLYTIYADEILLRGLVVADIQCAGSLHIGRHGGLDGDVHSRSMIVDKGGFHRGAVEISPRAAEAALPKPKEPEVRVMPGWQARVAFG
jgi:cytoskeletal protein CcmA (bactofilin family)